MRVCDQSYLGVATLLRQAEDILANREYHKAYALCQHVLSQDPNSAEARFLLGAIAAEHRNYRKAAELFERAIATDASIAKYHAHLAKCLLAMGRHADARTMADRATHLEPADALTLDTIGVVYSHIGCHDIAINFFERAVRRDVQNANYFYNLAVSQQFIGRFCAALQSFKCALALDPNNYKAYYSLITLSEQTPHDNHIEKLKALFVASGDAVDRKLHLGHALAKSYEDLGDYATSLDWLNKAKAAKKKEVDYSIDADRKLFSAAARTHDGTAFSSGYPCGDPIFIIGMPRTGTTLFDRILSSHPAVVSAGESPNFAMLVKGMTNTQSNVVLDEEAFAKAETIDLARLGEEFVAATRPKNIHARHFIDKTPLNVFYAGLISRAMPNSRIVCVRRHPMDTCLSNFRQLFATNNRYYNYSYDLESTAHYYALFEGLVGHWRKVLAADRFIEVHYESLVADQETETRRLLAFCGLEWDDHCLAFHHNNAPVATASSVQVRQPIYATSAGRWKHYGETLRCLKEALNEAGVVF
jgi:tetratricopeptide (TPR) repeat protein